MKKDLFGDLNAAQKSAVCHRCGPALVISGPGSGKTRVLTYHAAYLIQNGLIAPENIFLATFTNKAAHEMAERLNRLLGKEYHISWTGTFHALSCRILRSFGPRFGIERNFIIYDTDDSKTIIKKIIKEKYPLWERINVDSVQGLISSAKNEMIDETEYLRYVFGPLQEATARIYPLYQQTLRRDNALDFDDLILETVRLLRQNESFLRQIQELFGHVLIDEYQDTNKVQYLLAKLISAAEKNIYAVGDVSQAIYSFRGADFRNILSFEKDFPEAKIYHLSQNYRSTGNIIEAARSIIQNNTTHLSLDLWTDNERGTTIKIYEADDEIDEAHYVGRTIMASATADPRQTNFGDFAILYRTNAQSRPIEEVFLKERIPYRLIGGVGFYERREVKDVLAFLRLVVNGEDSASQERLGKISRQNLSSFLTFVNHLPRREELVSHGKPVEILDLVMDQTDYLSRLDDKTEEGLARLENIKELRSVAANFPNLTEFLENVSLIQQEFSPRGRLRKSAPEKESVVLMTLHSAKGLEFPTVFIVGLEEGLLPHSRALIEEASLEEERRLCYVGTTRAMKNLYLTYARQRLYFGSRDSRPTSRFVSEIPEKLVEFERSLNRGHA